MSDLIARLPELRARVTMQPPYEWIWPSVDDMKSLLLIAEELARELSYLGAGLSWAQSIGATGADYSRLAWAYCVGAAGQDWFKSHLTRTANRQALRASVVSAVVTALVLGIAQAIYRG